MNVRNRLSWIALCLALPLCACSGSGDEAPISTGGPSSSLVASFTAARPNPDTLDVRMTAGGGSGDQLTVDVEIVDTQGVYGAGFELIYDTSVADYLGHSAGTLLEQGGISVNYTVIEATPGRVLVSASRTGAVSGANATGPMPVIRLNFRAEQLGTSDFRFDLPFLVDGNLQDLTGIDWFGGVFSAN